MIVWIDIETAFLFGPTVEIAVVMTNNDLHLLMSRWGVFHYDKEELWSGHKDRLEEFRKSTLSLAEADENISNAIIHTRQSEEKLILGGSSVTYDRTILQRDFPKVYALLHYRSIDVSTLRELDDRWIGRKREAMPHTAMGDIKKDIAYLKRFKEERYDC